MRNPVIPAEEEVAVKKVLEALEELKEVHFRTTPNALEARNNDVLMLHSLVYLDSIHELVEAGILLKDIFEMTEEDFVETITKTFGCSVEEMLVKMMAYKLEKLL